MPSKKNNCLLLKKNLIKAVTGSGLGLWEVNIQNGARRLDARWAEILGYQWGEVGTTMEFWNEIIHPEDKEKALKELDLHLSGEVDAYRSIHRLKNKDGSWRWILDRGMISERDENGAPLFLVGTHEDIHDWKSAEERLHKEMNKLEAVLAALGDGLTIQDKDFKITYQNQIQKNRQGEHIGEYCYKAYHKRATICDGCLVRKCYNDGEVHRRETRAVSKDGNDFFMEVSASPIRDSQGEITGAAETVRDITQRKLLEKQLQQSQKVEAIGTLAGGIAHDFNNILAAIGGYAELVLLELPENSKLWNLQNEVLNASARAVELVKQILTFSRKENQELQPLQLSSLIKETLRMMRASIPSTIKIVDKISPQAGNILADPTQIHQVIMNLCTNAYHAMQETGGVLTVGLKNADVDEDDEKSKILALPTGGYVCLTVTDTGKGMEKSIQNKIFDPYFTTKQKGEGTGLGLAVVNGIVNSFGGGIELYSEVDKGTVFNLYFPRVGAAAYSLGKFKNDSLPIGTEHLLLIDDELPIVELQKRILSALGYKITIFTDSEKAFQVFSDTPDDFDLIITDMTMPNMTGEDLTKKVLAIRGDMPIIICTGFSNLIDEKRAKEIGARELLIKPVSRRDLAFIVHQALSAKL